MGLFKKINFGLSKTRNKMSGAIDDMLDAFDSFEDDLYTELEEILVMGDVGVTTAVQVVEELKNRVRSERIKSTSEVKKELENIIAELLYGGEDMGLVTIPSVILVIGVNGAGKTTTIGKMAAMYKSQGKKVLLGAADTFRAAAIDQLDVWAQRAEVDIIKHQEGADPAAVIFDTIQAGRARNCDIIICDTAGRLHNKKNLMEELAKIYRVIDKELPYSDREILLVLDATTGQNAVNQAKEFMNVAEITGIVLTKLDGTARGGVVLSIKNELKIPVKFIGVGEAIDDLQPFNPAAFAKSLFEAMPENYEEENNDGDSLKELVESDDYRNFSPAADSGDDTEAVKEILAEVLASAVRTGSDSGEEEYDTSEKTVQPDEGGEEVSQERKEEGEKTPQEQEEKFIQAQSLGSDYQKQKEAERIKAAAEKAAAEKAAAEKAAAEKAAAEKAAAEKAAAEKAAAEKAAAEKAAAEKAAAEKAAAEKAAAEKAAAEKAAAEKAAAEKAAAEKAAAEKAAAEKAAAEKAAAEKAAAEKAAAEKAAVEKAAAEAAEKKKERKGFFGLFNRHS